MVGNISVTIRICVKSKLVHSQKWWHIGLTGTPWKITHRVRRQRHRCWIFRPLSAHHGHQYAACVSRSDSLRLRESGSDQGLESDLVEYCAEAIARHKQLSTHNVWLRLLASKRQCDAFGSTSQRWSPTWHKSSRGQAALRRIFRVLRWQI